MVEASFRRPYLDASAWTELLENPGPERESEEQRSLRLLIGAVDRGAMKVFSSTIMVTEVLGGPKGRTPEAVANAELALQREGVVMVAVDLPVSTAARELRLTRHLDGMDAIHAASAALAGCDVFFTFDKPLMRKLDGWSGPRASLPYWPEAEQLRL
jgi:predicted nucleic acid-binding protein